MLRVVKLALFRFEASSAIGAGHAIRSCVLADALKEEGWECKLVTSGTSYDFIETLKRFERIDPEIFYKNPLICDLLVIDHYELGEAYEKHFREYAKKIMVIDDLANRKHVCDVLLDQTYGRTIEAYRDLVPPDCKTLTGSDYVLLRKEFTVLRPKALAKRRTTKEVKRILVSMGGSDPGNYTLKALEMIKESGFRGHIDVVLGFSATHYEVVEEYLKTLPNISTIHTNADMPQLILDADLAIGAAGSSVWERACLGLPQVLMQTADNQTINFSLLKKIGAHAPLSESLKKKSSTVYTLLKIDGFGINRIVSYLKNPMRLTTLSFRQITQDDKEMIYQWQHLEGLRAYCNNPIPPTQKEHRVWFQQRLKQVENPYWIIQHDSYDCGVISLIYDNIWGHYELGWFIIPQYQGKGLGAIAAELAALIVSPFRIHAFVKKDNLFSHKALRKSGFLTRDGENYYFPTNDGSYLS